MSGQRTVIESRSGNEVVLDPALMTVDVGYDYALDGAPFRAILRSDGSIDFFALVRPGIWSRIRSRLGSRKRSPS
jgi:hypothetical protein